MNDKVSNMDKEQYSYKILAQVIGLVSKEIYSRFSGMLIANSILIAFIGLILTNKISFQPLSVILSVIGLILCIIWVSFNCHGIYWQQKYKKEARKIEKNVLCDDVKIWRFEQHWLNYTCISTAIIGIFIVIYILLVMVSIYDLWIPSVQCLPIHK